MKGDFVDFMISAKALTFGDYVMKSGRSTPYLVDMGRCSSGAQMLALGGFYADCIKKSGEKFDALFGPAYKGIPLVTAAALSLSAKYGMNVPFCFNRKEEKLHGEGGNIVGFLPRSGDSVAIVEDVVMHGTSVRDTVSFLKQYGNVKVSAAFISVDRMEKGSSGRSVVAELEDELGIRIYPIVTVQDIIGELYARELADSECIERITAYLEEYGDI